jgi:hypothetical protein
MNGLSSYIDVVHEGFIKSFPPANNEKNLLSLKNFKKLIESDKNSELIEQLSAKILRNITQEVWST